MHWGPLKSAEKPHPWEQGAHDKHGRRGRVRAGWGWGTRSHGSMKSMAGCVGGLGKGNVCGDGRGAGAWVVGVGEPWGQEPWVHGGAA